MSLKKASEPSKDGKMVTDLIAVIPCAGKGTRMDNLTSKTHKALLKYNNITLLDYCISYLKKNGIQEIIIIVSYLKEQIIQHCKNNYPDIDIKFLEQKEPKGSAHAVYSIKEHIQKDFILVYPDNLFTQFIDLQNMIHYFYNKQLDHIAAVSFQNSMQFNRIFFSFGSLRIIDKNLFSTDKFEFNDRKELGFVSVGLSIFSKKTINCLPKNYDDKDVREIVWWKNIKNANLNQRFYLLYGQRHDFTYKQDLEKDIFLTYPKPFGVACIIMNENDEILMQHRDNNPMITYPDYWGLFGGSSNFGEEPYNTIFRELKEELSFTPKFISEIKHYISPKNKHEFVFLTRTQKKNSQYCLKEGNKLKYIPLSELKNYKIRDDDKAVLNEYFGVLL